MQNDKEASALIDNFVNLHTTHGGAAIIVDRGGYRYQWVGEVRVTATGREDALLHLFESIFEAGMSLGRKRTIDDMTKAGSDAVVKACADLQTALDDREEKRSAFSNAESEVRVQEIMVEKAKKAGAAVYEIIKAIEGK